MDINSEMIGKTLDTLTNITKTAANVTNPEKKKSEKRQYKEGDTNNQQHQQTVEVKVGNTADPLLRPMVIKEKPETHIHKHFPDNRPLTKEECELEGVRIQLEYEDKTAERNFKREMELRAQEERKEREAYEREERRKKEEERRKQRKIRNAVAGAVGIGFLGALGYCLYSDYRASRNTVYRLPETSTIKAEGEVK